MKLFRIVPLIVLSASLAFFNGCLLGDDSSSGDSVADNGGFGQNPDLLPIEDDIASGVSQSAVSLSLDMLAAMIEWSETSPGALRSESTAWNTEDLAWIISGSEEEQGDDVAATLQFTYWLQYRSGGVPQQEANENTDEIEIRADLTWAGTYAPTEGDYSVAFNWVVDYAVTGSRNQDESTSLVGSGTIDGQSTTTWQENTYNHEQNVSWSHDLDAAPGAACASGTINGSFSRYAFTGTLNGQGGVVTTLMRDGETIHTSDESYNCESPGGAGQS